MRTVVIYVGGNGPENYPQFEGDLLATIVADSGLHLAKQHNAEVTLIVGDMDSVDAHLLRQYEDNGIIISRFNSEKDQTDFELALMAAQNYNAESLVVVGGGGGRIDHLLANIAVLTGSQTENFYVQMFLDNAHIKICRPTKPVVWSGKAGDEVSLIPINGDVHEVTSKGLKWELNGETLSASTSRGISNLQIQDHFEVCCGSGTLAVIKTI